MLAGVEPGGVPLADDTAVPRPRVRASSRRGRRGSRAAPARRGPRGRPRPAARAPRARARRAPAARSRAGSKTAFVSAMNGTSYGTVRIGKPSRSASSTSACRWLRPAEADAEGEAGEAVLGEPAHVLALGARELADAQAGRDQELAALEPRRRVRQLGDVHPADRVVEPGAARGDAELEAGQGGDVADGEQGFGGATCSVELDALAKTLLRLRGRQARGAAANRFGHARPVRTPRRGPAVHCFTSWARERIAAVSLQPGR